MGGPRDLAKKQNSHLFLFDSSGSSNIGNGRMGNELDFESDTAEFRVYFVYKTNSFEPLDAARRDAASAQDDPVLTNSWKMTPWLRSFTLNRYSRAHTLYKAAVR